MIKDYKIFENLQQAEKFIEDNYNRASNNGKKKLPKYIDIKFKTYNKLKEYLKSKGNLGYLYFFVRKLFGYIYLDDKDLQRTYDLFIEYLNKISDYNLKIDIKEFENKDFEIFKKYIDEKIDEIETNKFIDKWAPGFLKKELKNKENGLFNKLKNILYHRRDSFSNMNDNDINFADEIDKTLLRGKISLFKEPIEWIEYVNSLKKETSESSIQKLKDSNDVDIYYDDDNWIIYSPLTYESINIIKFQFWCTIRKKMFDYYLSKNYKFIILFNKIIKEKSYIVEFPGKNSWKSRNDFSIYDYNHIQHNFYFYKKPYKIDDIKYFKINDEDVYIFEKFLDILNKKI